ncbi:hypothetical protein GCM10023092_03090 [Rurimicrobium arvi]|uniref:Secretion system C-terminal sorting domain-containing protein n=2 Tax=Rurimicrobium arvi TaxID=2049916 RepID=A0ABP8MEC6_9BACT
MKWKYLAIGDAWNPKDHFITTFKATDTFTVDGHRCTLIRNMTAASTDTSRLALGSGFITYEEAGVVYLLSPVTKKFTVLYDFNKKAGEGWSIYGMPQNLSRTDTVACPISVVVDSVQTVTINGINLKKMFVSNGSGSLSYAFQGVIIEGIGHTTRPFPWNSCISSTPCYHITDCISHYAGLRCIDSGAIGFYDFKTAPDCDWLPTGIKEEQTGGIYTLLPNPAQDHITMRIGSFSAKTGYRLQVSNLVGQTVHSSSLNSGETKISIAGWAPGLYFYTVYEDNRLTGTGKLIVQ